MCGTEMELIQPRKVTLKSHLNRRAERAGSETSRRHCEQSEAIEHHAADQRKVTLRSHLKQLAERAGAVEHAPISQRGVHRCRI